MFSKWTEMHKPRMADIFKLFPSLKLSAEQFVAMLTELRPRLYLSFIKNMSIINKFMFIPGTVWLPSVPRPLKQWICFSVLFPTKQKVVQTDKE